MVRVGPERPGAAVRKSQSGWGRSGHRRAVLVGGLVTVIIVGGAVAAWASVSSGSAGYRTASVTRADIGTNLTVVGNVEPVDDVAPSFQVGGQVATVTVAPGQAVTAGETLATLDTTALGETVSSDQSALNADQAKLVEDEESESTASSASSTAASGAASAVGTSKTTTPSSTTTTVPSSTSATASNATITQDQTTLTQDEATLDTDQQKEAADLTQAQSECTTANTSTPTGQATCEAGLQTVSTDEQQVSKDQTTVSKDETALGQALNAASGSGSSSGGTSGTGRPGGTAGSSPAQSSAALPSTSDDATLTADITGGTAGTAGSGGASSGSGTTDSDTPEQIASDQAEIDTAQAQLTEAQQSLNETTLTSPIAGTVVSVGINVGDTVSAGSSTEIITIIGTNSYEAEATLDSSQVPSVKVGQTTSVEVDGDNGNLAGSVAQVGPVQSSSSGYSYPVVVALPASAGVQHAGSAANLTISTGKASNVVAVPTSAVQTAGSVSYVTELDQGTLTRKVIKVGMVGAQYTQVVSGLSPGQSVVLADYAEAVPSSNTETNTFGGLGGLGGGGFGGGGLGGGGGTFRARIGGGGGFGG